MISDRENYLRTINFGYPEFIPMRIGVNLSSMLQYKQDMESVMARYAEFFPYYLPGQIDYTQYKDASCNIMEDDAWGYRWHYSMHGIEGQVTDHPISDWSRFATYQAPDSDVFMDRGGRRDWKQEFETIARLKESGEITSGGLVHGFLFLRLQYLRGFENLMIDMYEEEPKLAALIEIIDRENLKIVHQYCRAKVDLMELPEDLGAERSMIISRAMFLKYIIPSYKKMILPCKKNNVKIAIHSDGYIVDILEDLIEVGMDIINPQDLCNGIDNLARILKGKVCIRLDLDRVRITPSGTRKQIMELIEEEVKVLGSKAGGLEFIFGVYPPTSPDQVSYVCEAFKKYQTYWHDK